MQIFICDKCRNTPELPGLRDVDMVMFSCKDKNPFILKPKRLQICIECFDEIFRTNQA